MAQNLIVDRLRAAQRRLQRERLWASEQDDAPWVSLIDRMVDEHVANLRPLASSPQDERQQHRTRPQT
jgi:hypothetical protein